MAQSGGRVAAIGGNVVSAYARQLALSVNAAAASPNWRSLQRRMQAITAAVNPFSAPPSSEPAADAPPGRMDADSVGGDVVGLLTWIAMRPDNLVEERGEVATYRVEVQPSAEDVAADGRAGTFAAFVRDLGLRLRVVLTGADSVSLALLAGPEAHVLISCGVRPDRASLEVDLGTLYSGLQHMDGVAEGYLRTPPEPPELKIEQLAGRLRFGLAASGSGISATFSVDEPVGVVVRGSSGTTMASLAAGEDVGRFEIDGAAGTLVQSGKLGPMSLRMPYADWVDRDDVHGDIEINLAGLSLTMRMVHDKPGIEITDIGLGDATSALLHDGDTLISVDLNADKDRRFDVTITPSESTGQARLELLPKLSLNVRMAMNSIAKDFDEEIPAVIFDDAYNLSIAGLRGATLTSIPPSDSFPGGFKVNRGKLTLKTSRATQQVVVGEGKCLVARGEQGPRADEEHPFLQLLDVVKPRT